MDPGPVDLDWLVNIQATITTELKVGVDHEVYPRLPDELEVAARLGLANPVPQPVGVSLPARDGPGAFPRRLDARPLVDHLVTVAEVAHDHRAPVVPEVAEGPLVTTIFTHGDG